MDNEKLLKDIGSELDIFQAHIKRMKQKPEKLHALDVDLLQEKTRKIYDKLKDLELTVSGKQETESVKEPMVEESIKTEISFTNTIIEEEPEKEVETEIAPEIIIEKSVIEDEPIIKEDEEVLSEKALPNLESQPEIEEVIFTEEEELPESIVDEIPAVVEEKLAEEVFKEEIVVGKSSPVNEIRKPETVTEPVKETVAKSTIDLFTDSAEETIADKFGVENDSSIAGKMQQSQIEDLRQAIGINEKFLFINGLFNGDLGKYNKAIDEFNELSTKEGINTHFLELKVHNQWSDDNEGAVKLKALLDRKFN